MTRGSTYDFKRILLVSSIYIQFCSSATCHLNVDDSLNRDFNCGSLHYDGLIPYNYTKIDFKQITLNPVILYNSMVHNHNNILIMLDILTVELNQ